MTDLTSRATAAVLGAAVGDALGWPQENRSSNVDRKAPQPTMTFRPWRRRSGGRFSPYEEPIVAGTYSDDTQMICAVARSLARGSAWYEWLTEIELPCFPVYQRGAGRALLSACQAWAAGTPPWQPHRATSPKAYFQAGGNGAAMRVLPHAISSALAERPLDQSRLFRDAMTTHGHPRAGIGAALHATAVHAGLSLDRTLEYGELIELLLDRSAEWAAVPQVELMPDGWIDAWRANIETPFEQSWREVGGEVANLLSVARKGMSSGALASEQATLHELGCTGVKTVGSGTATAVGAVYLASRSAANPRAGVLAAAYLPKADTDTLASMTASLLGAFAGTEWMNSLHRQVQDSAYLAELAVASARPDVVSRTIPRVTKTVTDRFVKLVEGGVPGQEVGFADGRVVSIVGTEALQSKSQSTSVTSIHLRADDGQTLQVVRIHRGANQPSRRTDETSLILNDPASPPSAVGIVRVGVKLEVGNLEAARRFYEDLIGMTPTRSGHHFVTLNDILALSASNDLPSPGATRIAVYLDVSAIDELWHRIQIGGTRVIEALRGEPGRRRFRCLDPEGNLLEIRESG